LTLENVKPSTLLKGKDLITADTVPLHCRTVKRLSRRNPGPAFIKFIIGAFPFAAKARMIHFSYKKEKCFLSLVVPD
jgi:hypothetical protein